MISRPGRSNPGTPAVFSMALGAPQPCQNAGRHRVGSRSRGGDGAAGERRAPGVPLDQLVLAATGEVRLAYASESVGCWGGGGRRRSAMPGWCGPGCLQPPRSSSAEPALVALGGQGAADRAATAARRRHTRRRRSRRGSFRRQQPARQRQRPGQEQQRRETARSIVTQRSRSSTTAQVRLLPRTPDPDADGAEGAGRIGTLRSRIGLPGEPVDQLLVEASITARPFPEPIAILRGCACSDTGSVTVSTPWS